jgi:arylsulfatase A-like enzyme
MNDLGMFKVPVFFFHPTDSTWRGHKDGIIQQIDLMPTILHHAGYQGRYFAFGNDLLDEQALRLGSIAYIHDLYQLTQIDWLLQFDGERSTALYHYVIDPYFQANLVADEHSRPQREKMERTAKAFIQQYMTRMNHNRLTVLDTQPTPPSE